MADALFTFAQFRARIGWTKLRECFDDDQSNDENDETFSANVEQIISDATSHVRGALGLIYDVDQFTTASLTTLEELRRIGLDIAHAMAAQRHPEVFQYLDSFELMKQADRQLEKIRKGVSNLGTKDPPEPAANQGVRVSTLADGTAQNIERFSDDWGDF